MISAAWAAMMAAWVRRRCVGEAERGVRIDASGVAMDGVRRAGSMLETVIGVAGIVR